jgi:hypothetical protein
VAEECGLGRTRQARPVIVALAPGHAGTAWRQTCAWRALSPAPFSIGPGAGTPSASPPPIS